MSTTFTNADVARVFSEIADLLEIKGESAFRVNSYRRVARTLDDLAGDINDLAGRGELAGLAGVGKSSAEKIQELLDTGRMALRESLIDEVPESLLELLKIPGVGPKKVAVLWRERRISSIADLKNAIDTDSLAGLKGFGKKSIEQIRQGITFLESSAGRRLIGTARRVAEQLCDAARGFAGAGRVEYAGSLRRGRETVGDLDLLCASDDGASIIKRFTELSGVTQVLAAGATKGSVLYEYRPRRTIQIDLRVVPEESFGAAWQYFTGSQAHNVRLRELAVKRGWSLNEYGLSEGDRVIASRDEADIYAALGLPCYPPEFREDRFEFELDEIPADLLTLADIRGDLHMHTTASDGTATPAQMADAARRRGYEYICITDHSGSSTIANGLSAERMREHIAAVRDADRQNPEITVLIGAEVDILAEGRLDYPDDLLAQLDFVVASIHYGMGRDVAVNTQRTLAAMRNPYVNVIGHPSGRLLNRREAMPLDIEAICAEAARTGTALEINASPYRLDLKDTHARLAHELGAVVSVNTDTHNTDDFEDMKFGVMTARRAGLRTADVLNTWPLDRIREFVSKKRRQ